MELTKKKKKKKMFRHDFDRDRILRFDRAVDHRRTALGVPERMYVCFFFFFYTQVVKNFHGDPSRGMSRNYLHILRTMLLLSSQGVYGHRVHAGNNITRTIQLSTSHHVYRGRGADKSSGTNPTPFQPRVVFYSILRP